MVMSLLIKQKKKVWEKKRYEKYLSLIKNFSSRSFLDFVWSLNESFAI